MPVRSRRLGILAPVLLAAAAGTFPSQADVDALCSRFGTPTAVGEIENDDLAELSGLAASAVHSDVLWAVNDRGGESGLSAISVDGEDLGTYTIDGVEHRDWEDIAVGRGPEPGRSYIYIGDIGDNERDRPTVALIRIPEPRVEPDGYDRSLPDAEVLTLTYDAGATDAEALVIDPDTGDVLVIAKVVTGDAGIFAATAEELAGGGAVTMRRVGTVSIDLPDDIDRRPGTQITAADVSPDGTMVFVRTYDSVRVFARTPGMTVAEALTGRSCSAPQTNEPQGESLAVLADGSAYVTAPEIAAAVADGRLPADARPTITRVPIARDDSAPAPAPTTVDDSDQMPVVPIAAAAVGLVLVLVVVALVLRRRR